MRADLRLLSGLLRRDAPLLALATLLAVIASLLELLPYWLIYGMALALAAPADAAATTLAVLAGAILLAAVARLAVFGAANVASHAAAFRIQRRLRAGLLRQIGRQPLAASQGRAGELKKTLVDDVNGLEGLVGHTLPDAVAGLAAPLLASVWLFSLDWRMALASLALLPLACWAYRRSFHGLEQILTQWHGADTAANDALLAHITGIATLKAHDRTASSMATLSQAIHALAALAQSVTRRTATPYALFFVALSTNLVVVLPVGILLTAGGQLDPADLLPFVTLGAGLTAPLLRVLGAFGVLRKQMLGARRIAALLDAPAPRRPATPARPSRFDIRWQAASGGPPGGPQTLHDLTLHLPGAGYTLIAGPSGAGKSSLLGLLYGACELRAGQLEVGGLAWSEVPGATRAEWISCVFQDVLLFHGTLRDNLLIACPEASAAALARAIRTAGLDALLARLPQGLDTPVAERGASLSGGEKQRLALARAILADTPVLLLDEATSAADPATDRDIQQALRRLAAERNVIAVSHRLAHAPLADRVIVLDQGRIQGVGTHADLLAGCPLYRRLWQAQARGNAWTLAPAAGSAS